MNQKKHKSKISHGKCLKENKIWKIGKLFNLKRNEERYIKVLRKSDRYRDINVDFMYESPSPSERDKTMD